MTWRAFKSFVISRIQHTIDCTDNYGGSSVINTTCTEMASVCGERICISIQFNSKQIACSEHSVVFLFRSEITLNYYNRKNTSIIKRRKSVNPTCIL